MSTIELQNLTKSFGDLTAVNNISLKVNQDEVLCLLGPSGCGKNYYVEDGGRIRNCNLWQYFK